MVALYDVTVTPYSARADKIWILKNDTLLEARATYHLKKLSLLNFVKGTTTVATFLCVYSGQVMQNMLIIIFYAVFPNQLTKTQ